MMIRQAADRPAPGPPNNCSIPAMRASLRCPQGIGAWLRSDAINLGHVVVTDGSRIAVIPVYRHSAPRLSFNGAQIGRIAVPTDTVCNHELSRLFARHFDLTTAAARRYMSATVISTRAATCTRAIRGERNENTQASAKPASFNRRFADYLGGSIALYGSYRAPPHIREN